MRLTWREAGSSTDVTIRGLGPDATVADLAASLSPSATHLWVDGRPCDPDARLGTLLRDGAVVAPGAAGEDGTREIPDEASSGFGPSVATLQALAGPQSGRSWRLDHGSYRVAPAGSIDLTGPPAVLEVHADGSAMWNGDPFPEEVLEHGEHLLRLGPPTPLPGAISEGPRSFFNRPPRQLTHHDDSLIDVPVRRAARGSTRRISAIMLILPVVTGVGMALLFGRLLFLAFALLGPISMIGNAIDDRRKKRRDERERQEEFAADLASFDADLTSAALATVRHVFDEHPSTAEALHHAVARTTGLWQRRPSHHDHLDVVLGYGRAPWSPALSGVPKELEVQRLVEALRLPLGPIVTNLRAGRVLGIAGDRQAGPRLAADVLCQLATAQGPADVRVAIITERPEAWDWTKWLPHVSSSRLADTQLLAGQEAEIGQVLATLRTAPDGPSPTVVVVVDHQGLVDDQQRVLRECLAGAGRPCSGIVLVDEPADLPGACTDVVEITADRGRVRRPHRGEIIDDIRPGGVDGEVALAVARSLSPLDDPEAVVAGAGLPDLVRLLDLLDLGEPSPEELVERWRTPLRPPRLRTPLGLSEGGPFVVDLVGDGPHALMAGTTGSGKSELLRSLVAGLAAGVSPSHLTFVLVDYKGGAAFDACARLPHVVGLVTDLDEQLGHRALQSLEAELRHREGRLREARASDIDEFWATRPDPPLPRLVVVVDEFATLAKELPDFMSALVDIAQRGRSLGVHMVLATQRPSGVIKDSIRANTNLRLSLRVQSVADSKDVLEAPDAAALPRSKPGRSFARLGPGELIPFQAALATTSIEGGSTQPVAVPFRFGVRQPEPPIRTEGGGPSDLDRLVDAIVEGVRLAGLPPARRPWTDPLPEHLDHVDADLRPGHASIGLVDQPQHQRQVAWTWSPHDDGNLLLVGSPGWGPTEAMTTLATRLAEGSDPDDLHIYAIDHGPGGLAQIDVLPHVGDVVPAADVDRQKRLLALLRDRCRPSRRSATTVLLLDGIAGFKAAFEDLDLAPYRDMLYAIASSGPPHGVFVVVSADQNRSVPSALSGALPKRLVFSLSDRLEYGMLGIKGTVPDLPRRRAIDPATQEHLHIATTAPEHIDRVATAAPAASRPPEPIRSLPATVSVSEIVDAGELHDDTLILPLGIDDETLTAATVQLYKGDHLLIAGPPRSGRTTALAAVASTIRKLAPEARLIGVSPRPSPLHLHPALADVARSADALPDLAGDAWTVVIVDDAEELEQAGPLAELIEARSQSLTVIAAGRTDALRVGHRHWTKSLRSARRGVILRPFDAADGDVLGVRLPRGARPFREPGRGYLVDGGTTSLIQMAGE